MVNEVAEDGQPADGRDAAASVHPEGEARPPEVQSLEATPVVFVSYAREDEEFRLALTTRLESSGVRTLGDWCLPAAVLYRERLRDLILQSHSFLFAISLDSVRSASCLWELEVAGEHQKKIIPLVWREPPLETVPEALQVRQWIFLRNESDFERESGRLSATIREDLEWVQEHQYWEERAVDWQEGKSSLLHGGELIEATRWLERAETLGKVPPPTPLQRSLIAESRRTATRRTWRLRAAVTGFILFLIAAVALSLWQLRMTQEAETAADKNADRATTNARKAIENAKESRRQATLEREARIRETAATRRESGALASALARVFGRDLEALAAAFRGLGSDRSVLPPLQVSEGLADAVCATDLALALVRHQAEVTVAAISPDGKRVATGDESGGIQLWESSTGRPLGSLERHSRSIRFLTFLPGEQRLVSAGADQTAVLWNVSTRKPVAVFPFTGNTGDLRLSPDHRTLLIPVEGAGERDVHDGFTQENLILADAATGRSVLRIQGIPSFSRVIDFSSDGALLAAASEKEGIRVWRTADGGLVRALPGRVSMVAFLPDRQALLSGGNDNRLRLWDLQTGTTRFDVEVPSSLLRRPAVSPDGDFFLLGGAYGEKRRVWETATGKEFKQFDVPYGDEVIFLRDGRMLSLPSDGEATLWSFPEGSREGSFHVENRFPNELILSRRNERATAVTQGGVVQILDVGAAKVLWTSAESPDLKLLAQSEDLDAIVSVSPRQPPRLWRSWLDPSFGALIGHTSGLMGLAFSPTQPQAATAAMDGTLRLWDVQAGRELARLGEPSTPEWWASYSADGRRLVTTGQDDRTTVWDVRTRRPIFRVVRGFFAASQPLLSADGSRIARPDSSGRTVETWRVDRPDALSRDAKEPDEIFRAPQGRALDARFVNDRLQVLAWHKGGLKVWDAPSSTSVGELRLEGAEIYDGLFSADGTRVAITTSDGVLHLWDRRTHRSQSLTRFFETNTPRPAFSPDGNRIALAADGSVQIWDTGTGQRILTFHLPGRRGDKRIAFSSDGKRLATWGNDSVVRIWPATAAEFIRIGEKLLRYTPQWKEVAGREAIPSNQFRTP